MVVEKLLQLLVGEVDAKLFESVELRSNKWNTLAQINSPHPRLLQQVTYVENFETGNIEYTDKLGTLLTSFESDVDTPNQPLEQTIEHGLSHGTDGIQHLDIEKHVI